MEVKVQYISIKILIIRYLHHAILYNLLFFPPASMALMSAIGTLRGRRRWLWRAALGVRSVLTSCSSTDAPTSCRPPPWDLQQPHRPAWRFPPRWRSRTRATAPAWATARLEEQCPNSDTAHKVRVYVSVPHTQRRWCRTHVALREVSTGMI